MKFIARHLNLIGLLLLAGFSAAAAGLYFQTPGSTTKEKTKAVATAVTTPNASHKEGCCAEKPVAAEPSPAATCPHLTAQAARESSCCPKPAKL